jgi:uncharacterized membrane protein YkvA (DUF1232 family)
MQKEDFYQRLRNRIKDWSTREGKDDKALKYILMAPDFFHLLCKLMFDPRIPGVEKAKIGGAIAYFISPIDLVPEGLIGPAGYIDDVALAAYVLHSILNSVDPKILEEHWAGNGDVLKNIQEILRVADEFIGSGMWNKIKRLIK